MANCAVMKLQLLVDVVDVTKAASANKMAAAEIQIVNPSNLTKIER